MFYVSEYKKTYETFSRKVEGTIIHKQYVAIVKRGDQLRLEARVFNAASKAAGGDLQAKLTGAKAAKTIESECSAYSVTLHSLLVQKLTSMKKGE